MIENKLEKVWVSAGIMASVLVYMSLSGNVSIAYQWSLIPSVEAMYEIVSVCL